MQASEWPKMTEMPREVHRGAAEAVHTHAVSGAHARYKHGLTSDITYNNRELYLAKIQAVF